jgi:putative DNA primase/helicase
MAAAASLARRLDGRRQGHNWRLPCPLGCGYTLSICDGENGTLVVHCFGGCDYNDVLCALVERGLFNDDDDDGAVSHGTRPDLERNGPEEAERVETARWIYGRLAPAAGTVAEKYLRSRHIAIDVPQVLRFGNCPHRSGGMRPAMAAAVLDIEGNQVGVHMTYLRADGAGKADLPHRDWQRECRGVVRGGAIRLAPHNPDRELIVAEGVETTLSAMQIFDLPGWSAVSAGGLKTLELPSAVRRIVIAADNDVAGRQTALTAYQRWTGEGREVRVKVPPNAGDDFNDVLGRRGE